MVPDDPDDSGFPICSKCERLCEPHEIDTCPACGKRTCLYCTYRVGGRTYCSRGCGDAHFFWWDDDGDGTEPED